MGFAIRGAIVLACVVVLGVVHGGVAHGEPLAPGGLRLADVIAVAVRESPALARARIDLDAARAVLLQAEGAEDTHVGAAASANVRHDAPSDPYGEQASEHVEISASRALSTGGRLGLTASGDRQRTAQSTFDSAGNLQVSPGTLRYGAQLVVSLTQPLLRGGGREVFEAPIHQAAQQRDAAALSQEARARDLVVSLSQAYWQVAFTWRQLEVRRASLELAQQQLTYTEGAIRAEKVARSEALAVQEAIATRKQDVIAGEQDLYERSVALRQAAGLEITPDAIVVKTEELPAKITAPPLDVAALVRGAFEHSAELASLEAARHAAEVGVAAADNRARSQLDLQISGGPLGASATPSDALSGAVSHPGYVLGGSLTFDHAIERRTERGGQQAARAALLQAKVAEREARARLAVRATRAVQRAQAALASIALGDEAIGLAEQNITAEQKRFELGKSTNFEVLRRQDELEQARLRQASAVADYLSARSDLDGLDGAILARYGIVLP
jgi:outer membrane protein